MPAPVLKSVRVPFYVKGGEGASPHSAPDDDPPQLLTHVFIELIAFETRFFWLHVGENPSPAGSHGANFGACSLTLPVSSSPLATTVLLAGKHRRENGNPIPNNPPWTDVEAVSSTFASNLSQRLVRRLREDFRREAGVYVSCGVGGELLGTEAGGGLRLAVLFGNLVFKESLRLIHEVINVDESSE